MIIITIKEMTIMDRVKIQLFNRLETAESEDTNYIKIKGYACKYGVANFNGEVVTENSFDRFFNDYYKDTKLMPAFTYEHNQEQVIGKWTTIQPHDKNGMYVEGLINKNVKYCNDYIAPLVLDGTLSYLSTEGYCDRNSIVYNDDNTYTINDFQLTAISLVSIPACNQAAIQVYNAIKDEQPKANAPKYFLWL